MDKMERHAFLLQKIKEEPFLKDTDLAEACGVSVSTIRFDRAELGISEYRERVKNAAVDGLNNVHSEGEILELELFRNGSSTLITDDAMSFDGTNIVKGQCIYAFAENLALSVIDARAALVKVANVKYISEVHAGDRLFAHSEVIRVKHNEFIVHVFIKANMNEVFRGKFSLAVSE
ncbi:MAG: fatty acid biosynthesis transcriptional regulator [Oscillospiraceae bacterium]|nr:fatty acid biosynthesis transcriptional regulator [Oscillospiraceae bacterium]